MCEVEEIAKALGIRFCDSWTVAGIEYVLWNDDHVTGSSFLSVAGGNVHDVAGDLEEMRNRFTEAENGV